MRQTGRVGHPGMVVVLIDEMILARANIYRKVEALLSETADERLRNMDGRVMAATSEIL